MPRRKTPTKEERRKPRTDDRSSLEPSQRQATFLEDVIIYGQNVLRFAKGLNFASFVEDDMRQKAIVYDLLAVGEAIKKLTPSLKERHPDVQWNNLSGFRDVAAHKYWELDHELVWDAVQRYLPPAISASMVELERLLPVLP